jgi:hypothetical protein
MSQTPELDCVQRWLQAVITHPGGAAAGMASDEAQTQIQLQQAELTLFIPSTATQSSLERLEIYAQAFYARLLECLREEYPAVKQALGQELFHQFALEYLQQYPSRSYTLGQLGNNFPQYLAESRPVAEVQDAHGMHWAEFLIELARLERTISDVFDGPGLEEEPGLEPDQLLAIPAERWPYMRLEPAPCLRLLAFKFPVNDYYTAFRQQQAPAMPEPAETFVAVSRREYVVRRHPLTKMQYLLLKAVEAGESLSMAIGRAADGAPYEFETSARQLGGWFQHWAGEGFFRTVHGDS